MSNFSVKSERGVPALYIDGKRTAPVIYALSDFPGAGANTAYAQKNIAAFKDAGIDLVATDSGLHLGWRKAEPFDPEPIISELAAVLDANPNAKILLRLHMNPPYWWHRDNEDECVIYRTKEGDVRGIDNGEQIRLIANDGNQHMRVSLASEKWLAEACERLKMLLSALEGTPEGEALLALQFACGRCGEWHQWGTDVSKPMKERFKKYLKDKYGTEAALKVAWKDDAVTFDNAVFRPETFRPGDDGLYRDPQKSMDTIDSQHCIQIVGPEAILRFCKVAKEAKPTVLCGTFYGYMLGTGGSNMTIGGHLYVDMLHGTPYLDYLSGPFCYAERRLPEGITIQRALLESHRLNGMLWLTEMDQAPCGTNNFIGGDPALLDRTIATMRRNVLQPLLSGEGLWFYDHRIVLGATADEAKNPKAASIYRKVGWWDSPVLMAEIQKLKAFADRLIGRPYKTDTDVLLVYDTESYYCRAEVYDADHKLHNALFRAGAAFECIYSKDIEKCDMARYKCVIFVSCCTVTPEQREKYRRLTKGKMRIFIGGYGYCDGETLSLESAASTVGINLKKTQANELIVRDEKYTISAGYRPLFAVNDINAEPLAFYDNGEVAAARLNDDVVYPLPYIDLGTAKKLLKEAGVHIWCDSGEPVSVGYGYAALNCQGAGERTFFLPDGREKIIKTSGFETVLIDLSSGEIV